jgi:hypothetical protein
MNAKLAPWITKADSKKERAMSLQRKIGQFLVLTLRRARLADGGGCRKATHCPSRSKHC